ncbi:MAG TPA: hypothetical protein DCO65_09275, partial [Spartobacteria bacterium]|nr:hypothetical protein [Spartobacteria bacterium]
GDHRDLHYPLRRQRQMCIRDIVNTDPYGAGWMVRLKLTDPAEKKSLLDAAAYAAHIGR